MGGNNRLVGTPNPARGPWGATSVIYLATVEVITVPSGGDLGRCCSWCWEDALDGYPRAMGGINALIGAPKPARGARGATSADHGSPTATWIGTHPQ